VFCSLATISILCLPARRHIFIVHDSQNGSAASIIPAKPQCATVAEYPSPLLFILQCTTIQTQLYHSPLVDTVIIAMFILFACCIVLASWSHFALLLIFFPLLFAWQGSRRRRRRRATASTTYSIVFRFVVHSAIPRVVA